MRPGGRPPLHTQTFTLIIPGTQTALQSADAHGLAHSGLGGTHTCTFTHACCVTQMQVAISLLLWEYMPLDYICNLLQSPHLRLLPGLCFVFHYDSVWFD